MDSIDLDILKFMSERENYKQYKDVITKNLCTKESWRLVEDFGKYFEEYPEVDSIDNDFTLWFRVTGHPGWKPEEHELYGKIISNVQEREAPDRRVFLSQLDRTRQVEIIGGLHADLRNGSITLDDFHKQMARTNSTGVSDIREPALQILTLDTIGADQRSNEGLYWRLEDLNKSIGPVRRGDFIIVAKRPEVGGTSFLVSEMSFMLEQQKGNIILFNNEEAPAKVYTRMVSSALGVDYRTMMSADKLYQQKYEKWLDGREWDLVHDTSMTMHSINTQLDQKEYGLIGINVLLKVGGTTAKEDHDKLQALGEECRRISQQHGPVVAIVQADPSAEGLRYIPQDRIYKSKTALQGEADALIMIGKDHDLPDSSRFISVAKNKIPPAPCTDISVKHIKSEVEFDMGTGRYSSVNYKGHSRGKN
jgi:hypothetical protein